MKTRTLLALLLPVVLSPSTAQAVFHQTKIVEIFPGGNGTLPSPPVEAQYVMLQMYSDNQTQMTGHVLTVFDSTGSPTATFTFVSDLANGDSQDTVLLATTEAETFFGVTSDLTLGAGPAFDPSGGKVCFEDVDCVSWGNFSGNRLSPSPSGTPFGYPEGLIVGHPIVRDTSHGNPNLQDGDDRDDSKADFDCAATAEPTANDGTMGSYTDADPCPVCGDNVDDVGEQCDGTDDAACPGGCQMDCSCPVHDSVVLPVKPVKVKVPDDAPMAVTKKVKVKVLNADLEEGGNDTIQLTASSDCPAGVSLSTPDFDVANPGIGDSIAVDTGRKKTATVLVTVTEAAFTTFNAKALKRCTLMFSSDTVATNPPGMGGDVPVVSNLDPTTSNNVAIAELNVLDENDPGTASPPHESFAVSIKPVKVTIRAGNATATKRTRAAIGNADILPAADVDDSISLAVDVSGCPGPPTVSLDFDRDTVGDQTSALVDGGKTARGTLLLTFDASAVDTTNPKSPHRCSAVLTATGPSGPGDPDTTNNATQLVIDLYDKNDQ
jgi:hypothetical protein